MRPLASWRARSSEAIGRAALALLGLAVFYLLMGPVSGNRQAVYVQKALLIPQLTIADQKSLAGFASYGPNRSVSVLSMVVSGNVGDAENLLRQLLASGAYRQSTRFWTVRLSRLASLLHDPASAEAALRLATRIAPEDASAWYAQAAFYEKRGEFDRALVSYTVGAQADPLGAANGYMRSGIILYQKGDYVSALEMLSRSAEVDTHLPQLPNWAQGLLYYYLGDVQKRLQNWEESLVALDKVTAVATATGWPRYAAYISIGDIWLQQGELERSRQAYELAIQSVGNDIEGSVAHKALGGWYRQTGDFGQALFAYQQAGQLNPTDPWVFCGLGQVYELLGQTELAALQYQEALEIDPQMQFAQHALDLLRLGDGSNSK